MPPPIAATVKDTCKYEGNKAANYEGDQGCRDESNPHIDRGILEQYMWIRIFQFKCCGSQTPTDKTQEKISKYTIRLCAS